jgi:ATP-dependent DNA ligase
MALPLSPPLQPQLAKSGKELPIGEQWAYEPKYDGFRAIVFVDGDEVFIQSRTGKTLGRYFPELSFPPGRYVLDGEIVVAAGAGEDGEDFAALQNRLHPAASRVEKLAAETPAEYVAFDLLARDDESLLELPYSERRSALEAQEPASWRVAPSVTDIAQAEVWLQEIEGVIAKDVGAAYQPGKRIGFVKAKRLRTIDCVIAGYRPGKEEESIGSLMLGLYNPDGELRVIGHCSGFNAKGRREVYAMLKPLETGDRGHGDPSRWKTEKELEWVVVEPKLVAEVSYDHSSGGRIRHGTKFLRWRDDKRPQDCLIEQFEGA